MTDAMEAAWVRVALVMTDEDVQVQVEASDDLSVIEGAGMLAMATDTWMRTNGLRDEEG